MHGHALSKPDRDDCLPYLPTALMFFVHRPCMLTYGANLSVQPACRAAALTWRAYAICKVSGMVLFMCTLQAAPVYPMCALPAAWSTAFATPGALMSLWDRPAGYLGSNAIMGGMLLHQTRNVGQRYTCTGRFQRFIVACTVSGTVYSNGTALSTTDTAAALSGDTQSLDAGAALPPFGVDPVFLTGSAFYNPGLLGQIGKPLRCMSVAAALSFLKPPGQIGAPSRVGTTCCSDDSDPLQEEAVLLGAAVLGLQSWLLPTTVLLLCTAVVV